MPPCSPSQPLARLGGQFFQLLVERKSLPPGSSLRVGQGRSSPHPVPQVPESWKGIAVTGELLFAKHGLGSLVVKKLHTPSTATYKPWGNHFLPRKKINLFSKIQWLMSAGL